VPPRAKASGSRAAVPGGRRAQVEAIVSVTLLLAAIAVVGVLAVMKQMRDGNDFPIYWQAARDFVAGRGLYDVRSGLHGYVYLPWFALLLAPLAPLPLPVAAGMWYVLNLGFLWFAARAVVDTLRDIGIAPRARVLFLAALPLAGLAHDNLVLGQANLFLLLLIALVAQAAVRGRAEHVPGTLLAFAAALKMPAAMLLGPLALRGRARTLVAFAVAVVLALALPFARTGVVEGARLLDDWRAKVVAPAAAGTLLGSRVIDQSPHAGLRRLLVHAPAYGDTWINVRSLSPEEFANVSRMVAAGLVIAYALVWLLAPARGTPRALLLDLALACCAMVQVTGFNLKAQFVVLLLPAWAAASIAWALGSRVQRALLFAAGALFLLSQPGIVGRGASNWLLAWSAMGIGTLLLAVVCAVQRFAVKPATPSPSDARTAARATGRAA
jgi:hypothetical protein